MIVTLNKWQYIRWHCTHNQKANGSSTPVSNITAVWSLHSGRLLSTKFSMKFHLVCFLPQWLFVFMLQFFKVLPIAICSSVYTLPLFIVPIHIIWNSIYMSMTLTLICWWQIFLPCSVWMSHQYLIFNIYKSENISISEFISPFLFSISVLYIIRSGVIFDTFFSLNSTTESTTHWG